MNHSSLDDLWITQLNITNSPYRLTNFPDRRTERLPTLNYSILNDKGLRKRVGILGIPSWGPKQLLVRRHTEWVNLWNANCDSKRARTKRELLHDLDVWEKGFGKDATPTPSKAGSVMAKDLVGTAWAAKYNDSFQHLIAKARRKRNHKDMSKYEMENGDLHGVLESADLKNAEFDHGTSGTD